MAGFLGPILGFASNLMQMSHQKKVMNAQIAAQRQQDLYKGATEMAMQGNQMQQRASEVNMDATSDASDRVLATRQALQNIFSNFTAGGIGR